MGIMCKVLCVFEEKCFGGGCSENTRRSFLVVDRNFTRALHFHEWNYGVDLSLSWTHAFQINLFAIFGKFVGSWLNPEGLFMFCLSWLFKVHRFHEMYILLKI